MAIEEQLKKQGYAIEELPQAKAQLWAWWEKPDGSRARLPNDARSRTVYRRKGYKLLSANGDGMVQLTGTSTTAKSSQRGTKGGKASGLPRNAHRA